MGAWSSQYPVQVLGADQRDCGQPRRPRLVRGLGGIGKGSMIAAALTSPCLIRSDGRTITIEKLRFIECADGRFSTGVAGIPLRHATYSGTDLEQGRVKSQSASLAAVLAARSDARRGGNGCGGTGRCRGGPVH